MEHGFLDQDAYADSPIHRLDARIKVIGLLAGILVCVGTPAQSYFAFCVYAFSLLVIVALSKISPYRIFKRSLVVLPFILMIAVFAPFLKTGQVAGGYSLGIFRSATVVTPALVVWNVTAKALLSMLMVIVLTSTTPFPELLQALRKLRVPDIFVMLLSFTYRYLFVMIDEFQRMRRALASRGWQGKWIWHAKVIGQLIGVMFIRTYEKAERIYVAMISRGYDGQFTYLSAKKPSYGDAIFLTAFLGPFLAARIWLS